MIRTITTITGVITAVLLAAVASGADHQTPENLLSALYADHQPWKGREIAFDEAAELTEYFDDELTALLVRDDLCKTRTHELCNLDFDPVYCAQDYEDSLHELSWRRISTQPMLYEVTFVNLGRRNLLYSLRNTPQGWRIQDIQCPEGASLKAILSRPLQQ